MVTCLVNGLFGEYPIVVQERYSEFPLLEGYQVDLRRKGNQQSREKKTPCAALNSLEPCLQHQHLSNQKNSSIPKCCSTFSILWLKFISK